MELLDKHSLHAEGWRHTHLGRLLGRASARFDARVLQLMAASAEAPLALSKRAEERQIGAAIIHLTRHLPLAGARVTDLAAAAGMTKQSMSALVRQCEDWGLVTRSPDPHDGRVQRVLFTAAGRDWQEAFRAAVAQAEAEFSVAVGAEVAVVVRLGLEAYGSDG